jgi:hypothetical protein
VCDPLHILRKIQYGHIRTRELYSREKIPVELYA